MPAITFKEIYVPKIESGQKQQTIRRKRKNPIKTGDKLYLYTGLRTKKCKKIGEAICSEILKIVIHDEWIVLNNYKIRWIKEDYFAQKDGFNNWFEMRDFFKKQYGLPFEGVLIRWKDFKKSS